MFLNYIKEFSVKNKIKQFTKCKKAIVCGIIETVGLIIDQRYLETKALKGALLMVFYRRT
jgi:hypothetical protein